MTIDDVASPLATRQPDLTLPRPLYTEDGVFDFGLKNICYQDRMFAIPSRDIPRAGSSVTMQIGAYPIVTVRGADGGVRAFHNACRHHGSRVCTARTGNIPNPVCPHHQWTYELDRRLLYPRAMGADFKLAEHGLKPVVCEGTGGMVFVCLADNPPAFAGIRETAQRYLAPHRVASDQRKVLD